MRIRAFEATSDPDHESQEVGTEHGGGQQASENGLCDVYGVEDVGGVGVGYSSDDDPVTLELEMKRE